MKYILLLLALLLFSVGSQSTNKSPNSINTDISVAAKSPQFKIIQYFSLQLIPSEIINKEWYAFLTLKAPQQAFWMKFRVYLSTISKATGEESQKKVECISDHNDIHQCYISHKAIDVKTENLKVEMVFLEANELSIKIQINAMYSMKIEEEITLQKNQANFTRLFRIDIRQYTQKFDVLLLQLSQQFIADEYNNAMSIDVALQQTPPDLYRRDSTSFPFWDNYQIVILDFNGLKEVQYITIALGITDINTYVFRSRILKSNDEVQHIEKNKSYREIVNSYKNYRVDFPPRQNNSYYLLQLQIEEFYKFNLTNIKVNGKDMSKDNFTKLLQQSGSTATSKELDLWFNSTISSLECTMVFQYGAIFSISLHEFDINLVTLPQRLIWVDSAKVNETKYIYLVIDTKSSEEKVDLEVMTSILSANYVLNFRNCVGKTVQECQSIVTDSSQNKKKVGSPIIKPQSQQRKKSITFYKFKDLYITKHEIQPKLYRSIIIVQIIASIPINYQLTWHIDNPIQIIQYNSLVQGTIESNSYRIFCFTILDVSDLSFARVHFVRGSMTTKVFGSTQLINTNEIQSLNASTLFHEFDGSITFTKLKNKTTYYIYFYSQGRDYYQMTLTYGYNFDNSINHPISFLNLGEHTSNQLVLQPYQILYLDIKVNIIGFLTIQNTLPLKVCQFFQTTKPTSHNDMNDNSYCSTYATVNYFYTFNFNNSGRFYVGIENENSSPASIKLVTQHNLLTCGYEEMGQTKYLSVRINDTFQMLEGKLCTYYSLYQKGEVEILVDLNNPKLLGIAHPTITIGKKWQTIMNSNLLIISEENIDTYCQQNYQQCYLMIEFKLQKNHEIHQQYIAVTASYTSQSLTLKDGLALKSKINPNQIKHFKYPIFSKNSTLSVKVQSLLQDSLTIYAKIILYNQKFVYPKSEDYKNQSSDIYKSESLGYFYPTILTIPEQDIQSKCMDKQQLCYVLFTVYRNDERPEQGGQFLIQATQKINTLTSGNRLEQYLQQYSSAYFNFKNNKGKSLLFFTTTNNKDCLSIDVYEGNDGPKSKDVLKNGYDQVLIENAKDSWYTVRVLARDNCYFTIQVSTSKKVLRQLTYGYANHFSFKNGQKKYYVVHNHDLNMIKIIASLDQTNSGQLILQAMTVTDDEMGDFIKFINNELEVSKKGKLQYAWSDINHLTMREKDEKYCKKCYICIQAQASKSMEGYLSIPLKNQFSLYISSYISYDILLKGQTFTWVVDYRSLYQFYVSIQAGEMEIVIEEGQKKQLQKYSLKFNKMQAQKNIILLNITAKYYQKVIIKIIAIQNTDYSIYSKQKEQSKVQHFIEIGRPNYLSLSHKDKRCYNGILSDKQNQFMFTNTKEMDFNYSKQGFLIKGFINQTEANLKKQITPNSILFQFEEKKLPLNTKFKICFQNTHQSAIFAGAFLYLGNLNYFAQNSVIHISKSINLTFLSQGFGLIEVDECASRSLVSLNSQYKEIKNMNSKINSRRSPNNLISFHYMGSVYMNIDTPDYVALRWKNMHRSNFNGYGYQVYSPSTFRLSYDSSTQDLSLVVKPIQKNDQTSVPANPQILVVNYHVYVSAEQSDLYNAMNCQKGKYMYWVKNVENAQEITKQATIKLNNVADLKNLFKNKQYVLVIVKAEVSIKWPLNNFTQNYRFYYPYQELLLSQFHTDKVTEENDRVSPNSNESSFVFTIIFIVIAVIVVALLTYIAIKCIKRNIWKNSNFFVEEDVQKSEIIENNAFQLSTKIQSSTQNADIKSK